MEDEEEKPGNGSALRSAAEHFQLIPSGTSKYSRCGEAPETGMPAHSSHSIRDPQHLKWLPGAGEGAAIETGAQECPRKAQTRGQTAALHTASNAQGHPKPPNALRTARTRRGGEVAQECRHVQHVFHTGTQLWSLGLTAPGERGATGHSAGLRLGQHLTHGVGAEQHPPALEGHGDGR